MAVKRLFTIRKHSPVTWLVSLYVVFFIAWLFLRLFLFDQFWPLAIINTLAEYLFAPLPFVIVLTIWQRQWFPLLALGIPTIAFFVLFGELFLPSFVPHEDKGESITLMSFNVLYSNEADETIAQSIHTAAPDLVGLQELTTTSAQKIFDDLRTEYPYYAVGPKEGSIMVGLLSRFPLELAEEFPLPPLNLALHTIVNINGERVHVFVVHLSPNNLLNHPLAQFSSLAIERYGRRTAEVTRLGQMISGLNEPVLLMCDCNLTDTSAAYAHLDTFLDDSFREAGWGFGHSLQSPVVAVPIQRIDYVWHSHEFVAVNAFVGQDGESDHLPVVAELKRRK